MDIIRNFSYRVFALGVVVVVIENLYSFSLIAVVRLIPPYWELNPYEVQQLKIGYVQLLTCFTTALVLYRYPTFRFSFPSTVTSLTSELTTWSFPPPIFSPSSLSSSPLPSIYSPSSLSTSTSTAPSQLPAELPSTPVARHPLYPITARPKHQRPRYCSKVSQSAASYNAEDILPSQQPHLSYNPSFPTNCRATLSAQPLDSFGKEYEAALTAMQHTPEPSPGCVVPFTSQHLTSQVGRRQGENGTNCMSGDPSRSTPVMASFLPPGAERRRPSRHVSAQRRWIRTPDHDSPSNGSHKKELVDADSGIDRVSAGTKALSKGKGKEKEVVHRELGSSKDALPTEALTKLQGKASSSDQAKTGPSVEQGCPPIRSRRSFVSSAYHSSYEHQCLTPWLQDVGYHLTP